MTVPADNTAIWGILVNSGLFYHTGSCQHRSRLLSYSSPKVWNTSARWRKRGSATPPKPVEHFQTQWDIGDISQMTKHPCFHSPKWKQNNIKREDVTLLGSEPEDNPSIQCKLEKREVQEGRGGSCQVQRHLNKMLSEMGLLASLSEFLVLQSGPWTGPGRKGESAAILFRHMRAEKHSTHYSHGRAQWVGHDVPVPVRLRR